MLIFKHSLTVCIDKFVESKGRAINGAQKEADSVNSKALCQEQCLANPKCLAFDIGIGGSVMNQCWIYVGAASGLETRSDANFNHYARDPNSCVTPSPGIYLQFLH